LTPGQTEKELDDISLALSDNEFAKQMNKAKKHIWKSFSAKGGFTSGRKNN
jgi:hypothetical protein